MDTDLLLRLIEAVEKQNNFPWETLISFIGLLVTILVLLKELHDKNRPYMQISFELVRSTLACIVLKNTGNTPLEIKSLHFNKDFLKQLPIKKQEQLLKKEKTNIGIFSNRHFVISFDVNVFDIINDFKYKTVEIEYSYTKLGKKKKYTESVKIDFDEYSGMLLYNSELDELKNSVDTLNKNIKKLVDITQLENNTQQKIMI